jgi:hypothetical protein
LTSVSILVPLEVPLLDHNCVPAELVAGKYNVLLITTGDEVTVAPKLTPVRLRSARPSRFSTRKGQRGRRLRPAGAEEARSRFRNMICLLKSSYQERRCDALTTWWEESARERRLAPIPGGDFFRLETIHTGLSLANADRGAVVPERRLSERLLSAGKPQPLPRPRGVDLAPGGNEIAGDGRPRSRESQAIREVGTSQSGHLKIRRNDGRGDRIARSSVKKSIHGHGGTRKPFRGPRLGVSLVRCRPPDRVSATSSVYTHP